MRLHLGATFPLENGHGEGDALRVPMCLALPGKLLSIEGDDPIFRSGEVDFCGVKKRVALGLVPEAVVGGHVLVHVGVALQVIAESEAREIWGYLEQIGETRELEGLGGGS